MKKKTMQQDKINERFDWIEWFADDKQLQSCIIIDELKQSLIFHLKSIGAIEMKKKEEKTDDTFFQYEWKHQTPEISNKERTNKRNKKIEMKIEDKNTQNDNNDKHILSFIFTEQVKKQKTKMCIWKHYTYIFIHSLNHCELYTKTIKSDKFHADSIKFVVYVSILTITSK